MIVAVSTVSVATETFMVMDYCTQTGCIGLVVFLQTFYLISFLQQFRNVRQLVLSFLSLCIIYKCTCIGMVCLPMFPPEKCFNCDTAQAILEQFLEVPIMSMFLLMVSIVNL